MKSCGKRKKDKYELINFSIPLKLKSNFEKHWEDKLDFIDIQFNFLLSRTREQMIAERKMNDVKKKLFLSVQKKNMEKKLEKQKKKNQLLKRHQYIQSAFNNKMMLDMLFKNKKFMDYLMTLKDNNDILNVQDNCSKPENTINTLSNSHSMNLYSEIGTNQISTNSPISPKNNKKNEKGSYFITQTDFEPEKRAINKYNYNKTYYNSYNNKKTPIQKKGKNIRISSLNLDDKQSNLNSMFNLIKKNTNTNDKKKILMFNQKNSSVNDNKYYILSDPLKKNKKIRIISSPLITKFKSKNKLEKDEIEKTNISQNKKGVVCDTIKNSLLSNERKNINSNNKKNSKRPKALSNNISGKNITIKDIFINTYKK